jgi:hypothetical protein
MAYAVSTSAEGRAGVAAIDDAVEAAVGSRVEGGVSGAADDWNAITSDGAIDAGSAVEATESFEFEVTEEHDVNRTAAYRSRNDSVEGDLDDSEREGCPLPRCPLPNGSGQRSASGSDKVRTGHSEQESRDPSSTRPQRLNKRKQNRNGFRSVFGQPYKNQDRDASRPADVFGHLNPRDRSPSRRFRNIKSANRRRVSDPFGPPSPKRDDRDRYDPFGPPNPGNRKRERLPSPGFGRQNKRHQSGTNTGMYGTTYDSRRPENIFEGLLELLVGDTLPRLRREIGIFMDGFLAGQRMAQQEGRASDHGNGFSRPEGRDRNYRTADLSSRYRPSSRERPTSSRPGGRDRAETFAHERSRHGDGRGDGQGNRPYSGSFRSRIFRRPEEPDPFGRPNLPDPFGPPNPRGPRRDRRKRDSRSRERDEDSHRRNGRED